MPIRPASISTICSLARVGLRRAERPESRPEIVVGEGRPHQTTDVRDGIRVAEKAANLRRQRPRHFAVCAVIDPGEEIHCRQLSPFVAREADIGVHGERLPVVCWCSA